MPRGKKKTAAQHKKAGSFRPDRHETPSGVTPGAPTKPTGLSRGASKWWGRLSKSLASAEIICTIDDVALMLLCQALDEYEQSMKDVKKYGTIATSEKGGSYLHPAVTMLWKSRADIIKLLRKFGMTPLDRTGLGSNAQDSNGLPPELAAILGRGMSRTQASEN